MRRRLCLSIFALLLILLSGCGEGPTPETRVQVSIMEADGFSVVNNGLWVTPGEDAVLLLDMAEGWYVAETDYDGRYRTAIYGTQLELTLEKVQYPVRVNLRLTDDYAAITYSPNGGEGREFTGAYDLTYHIRPNTAIGTDLFCRDGYTLTSWNTEPDGAGVRVGLGSRVSVPTEGLTLYAQWEQWTAEDDFSYTAEETVTITGYHGNAETVVIPEVIQGKAVTDIAYGAFRSCDMKAVIFPKTMERVTNGAFRDCAMESVTLFDNIISIQNDCFSGCKNLRTLYINAIEAPYGYDYRRESCYADKVDLLINAQGQRKLVCYGGCAMWYNLDGSQMVDALGENYAIINLGLNGTVNSAVQMQILGAFLEDGDILLHTPELSSKTQLLIERNMSDDDDKLWCGLEYNYDLLTFVDLRTVSGVLNSFCSYLDMKDSETTYAQYYIDSKGRHYWDELGCIPFIMAGTEEHLEDVVYLNPEYINSTVITRLKGYYDGYQEKGVRVYISYACVNMDVVPESQRDNVSVMDMLFRQAIEEMNGPVLISTLEDYLYHSSDFYDTNYHLQTDAAVKNTALWLRDLQTQMELDGLWEEL